MTLKGLELATWVGWFSGIIVLKHPWGPPKVNWISFSALYSLFGQILYIILTIDVLVNNSNAIFDNSTHKFGKWIRFFEIVHSIVVTIFKRLAFFVCAKKLGKVLEILGNYEKSQLGKDRYKRCKLSWESFFIYFAIVFALISTFLRAVSFVTDNSGKPSWFNFLGTVGSSILYYIFTFLPFATVSSCGYSIISVTSFRVTDLFCDFCDEIEKILPTLASNRSHDQFNSGSNYPRGEIYNILKISTKYSTKVNKVNPIAPTAVDIISKSFQFTRQDIVDQFEEVKAVMKLTNEAVSGLLLWIIVSITLSLVTASSQLFVFGNEDFSFVGHILTLILVTIYGTLLHVGHLNVEKQRKSKMSLQRVFLNLPWTPEKVGIEDVIQDILDWEWKLSASGFFYLDKRLASGIFSLVLNYVVIVVQLNISITDPPPNYNCTGKNNTVLNANK